MPDSVYLITVPEVDSAELHSFFGTELDAFTASDARTVAIDLSTQSILYSINIGRVAMFIRLAQEKSGQAILFVPNDTLYSLLKTVHFERMATIVRDVDEFQRVCDAADNELAEKTAKAESPDESPDRNQREDAPAGGRIDTSSDARSVPQKSGTKGDRISKPFVVALCAAGICFIGAGVLGLLLMAQIGKTSNITQTGIREITRQQVAIDSLEERLGRCREHVRLLMELESSDGTLSP